MATTLAAGLIASPASAAKVDTIEEQLRGLSIEDLAKVEITSVFKRAEPVSKAPAAVFVITNDEIRRSGALNLPEALRLAPNLNVVRQTNSSYAITARGFNDFNTGNRTGNKLLVMIDGRTVYTPLFSGVFWDEKEVMLEDVERIEVVSGPGGTLWGANAVNGVINVITKNSRDSQGALASTYYGTTGRGSAARYGGKIAEGWSYRGYGMEFDREQTLNPRGISNGDDYRGAQGGFRTDATVGVNSVTFQGDLYHHPVDAGGGFKGHNILGRFGHAFDNGSAAEIQAYTDYSERRGPGTFNTLETYDVQAQYSFLAFENHQFVLGGGHRINKDEFINTANAFVLVPQARTLNLTNGFVQDTIELMDNVSLTLGTKLEYSDYSGLEHLPSGRLAWNVTEDTLLWTAVSRAVRSPNRIERELIFPGVVLAAPEFESEKLLAYEIGYRGRPLERATASVSLFYNQYDDLRSIERTTAAATPVQQQNRLEGDTYGLEAWGEYQVLDWWRLRPGFNVLKKNLTTEIGSTDNSRNGGGSDPEYQYSIRSRMDLPHGLELDIGFRYVDDMPNVRVGSYSSLDVRLGWHVTQGFQVAVSGFALLDDQHPESGTTGTPVEVRRGVFLNARLDF